MIIVDDQAGSSTLFPYIQRLTPNCILTRIEPPYGDVVWAGNGPDDRPLSIAVEYKQMEDVLDCMISGRFSGHQVGGLIEYYDRRWLLIEAGRFRFDRNTGVLQKAKTTNQGIRWYDVERGGRGFTSRDMEHWLTTMEEQAQFRVKWTRDEFESARWIWNKYTWWTAKGWNDHRALCQFHVPTPPTALLVKPSLIRNIAKDLPNLGWDKSMAAEARFRSVREMINAGVPDWMSVEGVGKTIAARIVQAVSEVRGV